MAKNPAERYATTVELARAARAATTMPLPGPEATMPAHLAAEPNPATAGDIHGQHTQLAPTGVAPVQQPPPEATPIPKRRAWRPGVVIPAVAAVVLLVGGGIFAAVKISQPNANKPSASVPVGTGPLTGTFTAAFGPETDFDGKPKAGATPTSETWGIRSVCLPSGCVATAARRSGDTIRVSTMVFDDVGGSWLAVGIGPGRCHDVPAERWEVFRLQPHPDGTLAGEYSTTGSNACESKRAVTFTRTGDVDVDDVADPAGQPPRVVSPAEALRGRYHRTTTYAGEIIDEIDLAVRTECLRTGDRCMSYFENADSTVPLVFGGGKWIYSREVDGPCPAGGTSHVKAFAEYPLPVPPGDPIMQLTGQGHQEETGSMCGSTDFDDKFARIGDLRQVPRKVAESQRIRDHVGERDGYARLSCENCWPRWLLR